MKKLLKTMKPGDLIIIVLLVFLSFLPVILFSMDSASSNAEHNTALISANGEVLHEMALMDDGETETYEHIDEAGHRNIIVREGTEVYMIDASCADQLCVRQGTISQNGETIVCLPHRVVVEVSSDTPESEPETEIDVIS